MRGKVTLIFILILSIGLISAGHDSISQSEIEAIAAKYNIDTSSITAEEVQQLADQNNIDIGNIGSEELEKAIKEYNENSENVNIDKIKNTAENIGIDTSKIDNVIGSFFDSLGCQALKMNSNQIIGKKIPDKIPFKNEIFNLYISEDYFATLTIYEGSVSKIDCNESFEQTYNIYIKEYSDLLDFANGFDVNLLNEKIKNNRVEIEGIGIWKKIKLFFSKLALKWFF